MLSYFSKLPIKKFKAVEALDLVSNERRGELIKVVIAYYFHNIWIAIRILAWRKNITQQMGTRDIRKQKIIFSLMIKISKRRHILLTFIWIEQFLLLELVKSTRIELYLCLTLFVSFVLLEMLIFRTVSKIFIFFTQSSKLFTHLWWVVFLFWNSITLFRLLLMKFCKPFFLMVLLPLARYLYQQSGPSGGLVHCCTSLDHNWFGMRNI